MTTMTDTNTADTTTALFAAIDSGNEDRVIELINAGADIFATDAEGASTLTHAQRQGNETIIQTLQMMAEAQGKEFQDAPDDGDAKDAAGEEEPDDGTTVLTDSVDVPEIEEGFFVEPDAIVLDKEFKKRWKMLSSPELLHECVAGSFGGLVVVALGEFIKGGVHRRDVVLYLAIRDICHYCRHMGNYPLAKFKESNTHQRFRRSCKELLFSQKRFCDALIYGSNR